MLEEIVIGYVVYASSPELREPLSDQLRQMADASNGGSLRFSRMNLTGLNIETGVLSFSVDEAAKFQQAAKLLLEKYDRPVGWMAEGVRVRLFDTTREEVNRSYQRMHSL